MELLCKHKFTLVNPSIPALLSIPKATWVDSTYQRFYNSHLVGSLPTGILEYLEIPALDTGWYMLVTSILWKLRQMDCECKVSLSYLARPQEKKNKKNHIVFSVHILVSGCDNKNKVS